MALRAPTDRALRARAAQILFDLVDDIAQVFLALGRPLRDQAVDLLVDLRVQRLEREFLELPLHHVHAEAVSQRRVDLEGLLGFLRSRLGGHETPRARIVQAVAQLNEQDTNVAAHCDEHLAQCLRLGGCAVMHLVELGDAIDKIGDRLTVLGCELFEGVVRVLDCVVQQRSDKSRGRHTHFGKDGRDGDWMGDIGFTGLAHLPAVVLLGGAICALDDADIRLRMIRAQSAHERLNLRDCGATARAKPNEARAHSGTGRGKCGS